MGQILTTLLPARHAPLGPRACALSARGRGVTEFVVVSEELGAGCLRVESHQPVSVVKSLLPRVRGDEPDALPEGLAASLADYTRRRLRVCSVGAFIPEYGFLHAARAVERVRRETGEDVGLLLLDGDFAADDAYREDVLRGREWVTVLKNVAHADVFPRTGGSHAVRAASGRRATGSRASRPSGCGLPSWRRARARPRGIVR